MANYPILSYNERYYIRVLVNGASKTPSELLDLSWAIDPSVDLEEYPESAEWKNYPVHNLGPSSMLDLEVDSNVASSNAILYYYADEGVRSLVSHYDPSDPIGSDKPDGNSTLWVKFYWDGVRYIMHQPIRDYEYATFYSDPETSYYGNDFTVTTPTPPGPGTGSKYRIYVRRSDTHSLINDENIIVGNKRECPPSKITSGLTSGQAFSYVEFANWQELCNAVSGSTETPTLRITPPELTNLAASGAVFDLTVRSNTGWTITGNLEWVRLSKTSGTGNDAITVNVLSNEESSSTRSLTLTGKTTSTPQVRSTVRISQLGQEQPSESFDVDTTPAIYTYLGGGPTSRAVTASTTVSWVARTEADWITLNTNSGTGNGQVKFTIPSRQYLYDDREADIMVSANTGQIKYIHVTQQKHPYMQFTDPNNPSVSWPIPLIFQEGGFAYQLRERWQYTRDIKIYTNYPIDSVTTDTDWSSTEFLNEFEGGYEYRVYATACLQDRTFNVTVKSTNTNLTNIETQVVQYYLTPQTQSNDFIAVSTDGDWSWPSEVKCTEIDFGEIPAAAATLNFYVWTTAKCKIESVTGETPFRLFDMYDNEIVMTDSGTAGKWLFGPYGTDSYSGWINGAASVPMVLKIPTNSIYEDRSLKIKLATLFYSPSDLSWKDHAILKLTQKRMTFYDDNYNIDVFIIPDIMTPFETDVTIDSSSRTSVVMASVTCTRHWADGHDVPGTQVIGYTSAGGHIDNLIKLEVNTWAQISNDYTHEGGYYATDTNPFEVYIPANQSYSANGDPKVMEFTLTYMGCTPWVSKTITVTQEWSQKPDEDLNMFLYVSTYDGGSGENVKEDNVNVRTAGSQKTITFSLNSGIGTDIEYMMITPTDYPGSFIHSDDLNNFLTTQTYPGQNHGNWTIRLRDDLTRDFDIEIDAHRADNTHVSTVLTLHVKNT